MLFSVLIPAYKKKFLKECIDSILNQTFQDFEVIIVNDASPEGLDSIVNLYCDSRIRYYKNEVNCGAFNVVDNWNKCLGYSQGDYIMCIGDDDFLMPDCLLRYSKAIACNQKIDVFHCRSYIVDEDSRAYSLTPSWPEHESVYDNIFHRIYNRREHFVGDFLYRRDCLIKKGGFYKLPLAWASDDITSYIVMDENGIVHINEPLFCYRQSQLTLSTSGSVISKLEAMSEEEAWYNHFIITHTPSDFKNMVLYENIKQEIPHFLKIKRIETIAYFGFSNRVIKSFFYWRKKKDLTRLSLKELIYAMLLAYKKKMS